MIRTLDRYLLRSFFSNYLLALFVMISLYVILDLFVNLDEFTEGGKPIPAILMSLGSYYAYNLPLYFSQLSGVITLFAACGTFARLQRQNEITAVLASGTSLYRLATPIILAAVGMNALLVFDQEVLLPRIAPKLVRERDDVEGARVYDLWFVRDGQSRLISALQFSPGKQKMSGLMVMELKTTAEGTTELSDVITADWATWNPKERGWDLLRGVRISMISDEAGIMSAQHELRRTPVKFYATDLTPEEFKLRQTAQWMQFLSVRQLNQLAKRGDVGPRQIAQIRHTRFTQPINNMILLLLGVSFFMSRLPKGVLTQGSQALVTCSLSFLVAFAGQQIAGSAGVSPALPAWLPIFLFGPIAVVLLDNVKT